MLKKISSTLTVFAAVALVMCITASGQSKEDKSLAEKRRSELEKFERELRAKLNQLPPPQEFRPRYTVEKQPIEVKSRYDRFKDETTRSLKLVIFDSVEMPESISTGNWGRGVVYFNLGLLQINSGMNVGEPSSLTLHFNAFAVDRMFTPDPSVIFLVDGERVILGPARLVLTPLGSTNKFEETAVTELPYNVLSKIAHAQNVEAQVGRWEFKLLPRHLEAFRIFLGEQREAQDATPQMKPGLEGSIWKDTTSMHGSVEHPVQMELLPDEQLRFIGGICSECTGTWKQVNDTLILELPKQKTLRNTVGLGIIRASQIPMKIKQSGKGLSVLPETYELLFQRVK